MEGESAPVDSFESSEPDDDDVDDADESASILVSPLLQVGTMQYASDSVLGSSDLCSLAVVRQPELPLLPILFQDEYLAIVNKPSGLSMHPTAVETRKTEPFFACDCLAAQLRQPIHLVNRYL